MARIFTITEGLENLGAMKTGGQGSVYKGRRVGEIITAIKLLPTPIYSESGDDKNFMDFQNEVEKLKKVNENPNPHVVTILSSGITDSGNFPFIEMEYIEGPDLEDLLKPPHDPVFTIKEVLKVAEHLSNALSHCHKIEVRHGDMKSNNIKFNVHSGNYILLDFGLAVMSDEQRRTSLRHAGAIEFMAPEQNDGQMLFQTDVYGFGVIMFELLAGIVPFPLSDKGETARNNVRLSHIETPPPDVLALRQQRLPDTWDKEKKEREMRVPGWLVALIYRCLEKNPADRFVNGIELHEYIVLNSTLSSNKIEDTDIIPFQEENLKLAEEKTTLQKLLLQYQEKNTNQEEEIVRLKNLVSRKDAEIKASSESEVVASEGIAEQRGVSKTAFYTLVVLTICIAALAAYSFFGNNKTANSSTVLSAVDSSGNVVDSTSNQDPSATGTATGTGTSVQPNPKQVLPTGTKPATTTTKVNADSLRKARKQSTGTNDTSAVGTTQDDNTTTEKTTTTPNDGKDHYKVTGKAYFYDKPDEETKRDAFITHWNNAILSALDELDGFIYVVFTNASGQTSKGWIRKKDLIAVNE